MPSFKMLNIDGIDGCGKTTVISEIEKNLKNAGKNVIVLDFPYYSSDTGKIIKQFLHGDFGNPATTTATNAAMYYTKNRIEWFTSFGIFSNTEKFINNYNLIRKDRDVNFKEVKYYNDAEYILLSNRSFMSNLFFQGSKLISKLPNGEFNISDNINNIIKFILYMSPFEFELTGINKYVSNIYTIFMYHESFNTNISLLTSRSNNDLNDMHESNHNYLYNVNEFGIRLCSNTNFRNLIESSQPIFKKWDYITVACSDSTMLYSPIDIAIDILERVSINEISNNEVFD